MTLDDCTGYTFNCVVAKQSEIMLSHTCILDNISA